LLASSTRRAVVVTVGVVAVLVVSTVTVNLLDEGTGTKKTARIAARIRATSKITNFVAGRDER
jgi:hypothetical protein